MRLNLSTVDQAAPIEAGRMLERFERARRLERKARERAGRRSN